MNRILTLCVIVSMSAQSGCQVAGRDWLFKLPTDNYVQKANDPKDIGNRLNDNGVWPNQHDQCER